MRVHKENKCVIHGNNVIQLGSCLTCLNKATICEIHGCINYHQQNDRAHNVVTIEQVHHIVSNYTNSNAEKKAYLKKMVYDYFTIARNVLQDIFTQVHDSVDQLIFTDVIFQEDEQMIIRNIIDQNYERLTCTDVANILPKLVKCTNIEDGHFLYLRSYLLTEKERVSFMLDNILLKLNEFRWRDPKEQANKFVEIIQENLKDVNNRLAALEGKPKRLRLKFSTGVAMQSMYEDDDLGIVVRRTEQQCINQEQQLIRLLGSLQALKNIEYVEIFNAWDVNEDEYQIGVAEALAQLPFIKSVSIFTGYKITSAAYLQPIIAKYQVSFSVFTKDWAA